MTVVRLESDKLIIEALQKAKKERRAYNAHSVGIGYKYVAGKRTDTIAIVFYVHDKKDPITLEELKIKAVPEKINGIPTDVRVVPKGFTKRAIPNPQGRFRPFPGGVTGIAAKEVGAATLGYVNRIGEVLSNNHVLASEDLTISHTATKGDRFLQPSWLDGGSDPADEVGSLDRWVSLIPVSTPSPCSIGGGAAKLGSLITQKLLRRTGMFAYVYQTGVNYIDGAVGVADESIFQPGVLGLGEAQGFVDAVLGMKVQKIGRTTGYTQGIITAIGVTVTVGGYQGIYSCDFEDQITVETEGGKFSDAGDSGSAILTLEDLMRYLALLFAGGTDSYGKDITIGCPSKYVQSQLNYKIP